MNNRLVLLTLITASTNVIFCCTSYTKFGYFSRGHVAALILARGGSKGIPLKNLAKIGDSSLLQNTLKAVSDVKFSSVWVSTDDKQILSEAGAVNVHWRSKESADDTAPSIVGVLDFIESHPEIDVIALIQCTSPFIRKIYLQEALEWIYNGKECVFSATRSFKLRWSEGKDSIKALNFNLHKRPRRQDWNGELVENGMFYFMQRRVVNRGFLQTDRSVLPIDYLFRLCDLLISILRYR